MPIEKDEEKIDEPIIKGKYKKLPEEKQKDLRGNISINDIALDRRRKPLSSSVISFVNAGIKKIERTPFKKKEHPTLHWRNTPETIKLPSLAIDIPIVEVSNLKSYTKKTAYKVGSASERRRYNNAPWKTYEKSVCITHKGRIMVIFITEDDDKAIRTAGQYLHEVGDKAVEYYPEKSHQFYSGLFESKTASKSAIARGLVKDPTKESTKDIYRRKAKENPNNKGDYIGWNARDGMIRYLCGKPKCIPATNIIAYMMRSTEADKDINFMKKLVYSFTTLYSLEKRHIPQPAKYRLDVAKSVNYPKIFPKISLEKNPATTCGLSLDFGSTTHNDSTQKGIVEAILYAPNRNKSVPQYFNCSETMTRFKLNKYSVIYIQGDVWHGTQPTGKHGGVGFVNITKKNLTAQTPFLKKWYSKWNNYFNSR